MADNINLDFDTTKESLKTFLKSQTKFVDFDFEASNMAVMLDVLAFNTVNNALFTNMSIAEMFLDSAQLRESVISHAKQLNYLPSSRKSAKAIVDIVVTTGEPEPDTLIIVKGTEFRTIINGKAFTFTTDSSVVMTDNNDGTFTAKDVSIFEGKFIEDFFVFDNTSPQTFVLNSDKIDLASLEISIKESVNETEFVVWNFASSLLGLTDESEVFFLQPSGVRNYELNFGDDIVAKSLVNGNVIKANYRISRIDEATGANVFKVVSDIQGFSAVVVTTVSPVVGGTERENIASIKLNAPRHFQTQERAITPSDYRTILLKQFPDIQTLSVYGGENLEPPQFGKVAIAVDMKDADGIPDVTKILIADFLLEKAPISIRPIVVDPEFIFINISGKVFFDVTKTVASALDIESLIITALTDHNTKVVNKFDSSFKYSVIARVITDAHIAITSTDFAFKPFIKIAPTDLSVPLAGRKYLFFNEIKQVIALSSTSDYSKFEAPVISSSFISNGQSVFIEDDGTGTLQVVTTDATGNRVVVKTDIGSVDYITGAVTIKELQIDSFDGDGIRLNILPKNKDFFGTQNKILSIDTGGINLQVIGNRT